MSNDWEISRGTGKCAATGRELAEGEFYYAALFEQPQGFERRDYSVEGWSGPPPGCIGYWKARVPTREKKPSVIAVDNGLLVNLFCRLEDDSSPMRQKLRFVLALLLMRKRLLRFEQAVRDGNREHWQMRLVAEQSVHQVLNPNLSSEEIDRLSAQLTAILSGDASAISALEEQAVDDSSESQESDGAGAARHPADGPDSPAPDASGCAADVAEFPGDKENLRAVE